MTSPDVGRFGSLESDKNAMRQSRDARPKLSLRRWGWPLVMMVCAFLMHYLYLAWFPETPSQGQWISIDDVPAASAWQRYVESKSYWLGWSYAISFGFAVTAFFRWRERRSLFSGGATAGGATLAGSLAVAGCFLTGCCGSPMLGVYLSLFGASFLPWAKPLVAMITTILVVGSWVWLIRSEKRISCGGAEGRCNC